MIKIGIDATFNLHGGSHGHLNEIINNSSATNEERMEARLKLQNLP